MGIVMVPQADAVFVSIEDIGIVLPAPYDIAEMDIDSNGNIYVSSDNSLKKFDNDNQLVWEIEIYQISSLHIDSDLLYIHGKQTEPADPDEPSYVGRTTFVYSTEGNFIEEISGVYNFLSVVSGIFYNIQVLTVHIQDTNNDPFTSTTWVPEISTDSFLPYPDCGQCGPVAQNPITGLAVDSNGFIYLGQYDSPYVYKYTSDGTFVKRWLHEQVIDGAPQNKCAGAQTIWVSQDGNIVVYGEWKGGQHFIDYCNQSSYTTEYLVTKYSPDGDYIIGFDPSRAHNTELEQYYIDMGWIDKRKPFMVDSSGDFISVVANRYLDRYHVYLQNDPPSVSDQTATTTEEESVQIQLTATDIQSTQPLSFFIIDHPSHGSISSPQSIYFANTFPVDVIFESENGVQGVGGCGLGYQQYTTSDVAVGQFTGGCSNTIPPFTYTPDPDHFGLDSFTFIAYDGFQESNTATVNITVNPVNDAPITADKSDDPFLLDRLAVEDVPENITLIGTDVDGDTISYIIVDQPLHGTLTGTPPNLIYTPNADYNGGDSFKYKANDGILDGSTETVSISISSVNDIPVAQAGSDQSVDAGSVVQLDGSQSSDVDGDTITYSWIQTSGYPVTLTADNIASPQFTAPSQAGQLTFMLTLNDGTATSSPNVVNIYVGQLIPDPTPPPAPESVASSASDSQITLTWSSPSDDGGSAIMDYLVEYATADGEVWIAYDDGTSTATSATITGLSNGQEYNFRISAVNSEGIGDASGSVVATPSVEPEVEPEIIPEEPEPVMEIEPDAEPEMTSEAVPAFEPEPKSEASQSSVGCGAGTVMVNGVCQLAKTSGTSMAIEPIYIVIAAVAVGGGAVGALFALKRGSGTPKPRRQDLDEYESRYVERKPAEKKETSSSCNSCGKPLKPTAKFCGSCGTSVP